MAMYYYQGSNHYTKFRLTANLENYSDVNAFRHAVDDWLSENKIRTLYEGQLTRLEHGVATFEYIFQCLDPEGATAVALRWA